jgi:predicted phosphodiesterase
MRIAVLADVHGNRHALAAVTADLRRQSPDLVVNLGDLVSGPFDPAGSADAQMALGAATLMGNHDRWVLEGPPAGYSDDALARTALSDAHRNWMAGLPPTLSLDGGDVFACHGSPAGGDLDYLLEDVDTGRALLASPDRIRPRLGGIGAARLVLCAHSQTARTVSLDGLLIVNPGSVGMPGYADDLPVPHVMEAGTTHALYAVVERTGSGWTAALRAVPYDHEAAAREAERAGRPAIAHSVRTGRMPA